MKTLNKLLTELIKGEQENIVKRYEEANPEAAEHVRQIMKQEDKDENIHKPA